MAQIAEVEAARDAVVTTTARPEDEKFRLMIANLTRLRGIGPEIATVLVREIFYRCFGNRRQGASYAGLTPSPYASGGTSRDQGISKETAHSADGSASEPARWPDESGGS